MKRLTLILLLFWSVALQAQVSFDPPDRKNVISQHTNNRRNLLGYTGVASARFSSAIAALPSTGGIADGSGLQGAQTWSTDFVTGIASTKPVLVELGAGTTTLSVNMTVPAHVMFRFNQGSVISVNMGVTLTINGPIDAPIAPIFTGSGTVLLGTKNVDTQQLKTSTLEAYPQWFGAVGDGIQCFDGAITASDATLTSSTCNFPTSIVGKPIVVEGAGAASDVLITTVASRTSSTSIELTAVASTTVSNNGLVVIATDDTSAIQKAIAAHYRVQFLPSIYGVTELDLLQGTQLLGAANGTTILSRMGAGGGGPMVGMTTGHVAAKLKLENLWFYGNQVGTALDCIDFAEQGNNFAYGFGSWMDNLHTNSCSGIHYDINSNVGEVGQLWALNLPTAGTSAALSNANAKGFRIVNTDFSARRLNAEGHFEAGDMQLSAQGSTFFKLQIEPLGTYASTDAITVDGPNQVIYGTYAQFHTGSATRRDMVRISAAGVRGFNFNMPDAVAVTCSQIINITYANPDKTYGSCMDGPRTIQEYSSLTAEASFGNDGQKIDFNAIVNLGASSVVSASTLEPGNVGNVFSVTGNNAINYISTVGRGVGAFLVLLYTGTPTIAHNAGSVPMDTFPIFMAPLANRTANSNAVQVLYNNGTAWYEASWSANTSTTVTVGVRDAGDMADCSITFRGGLFDSTTC